METKQVIVVRKDLNMRKGKLAAQCCHASMGVLTKGLYEDDFGVPLIAPDKIMMEWLNNSFTKIVVYVNSEKELLDIFARAENLHLHQALIQDNGRTEFHGVPTYTAVAVGPGPVEIIDIVTGHLPLL